MAALFLMAASVQTVRAQKVVFYKTGGEMLEYAASELDSITFATAEEHEWVDLGLPSGTLWATCNVGANSPEEYGDYFAWGETESKGKYNWSFYKWSNGLYNTMKKYCQQSVYGYNAFTDTLADFFQRMMPRRRSR